MKSLRIWSIAFALLVSACSSGIEFDAIVLDPAYERGTGPTVLFDAGHHNHHAIGSTYRPFANLMTNDGFQIVELYGQLSRVGLRDADILVIVAAQADTETNSEPAFSRAEISDVVAWVHQGGSLLLVTDHYPFANAAEPLANALGLEVSKGMVFDEQHFREGTKDDSRLIFSRENGLLSPSPILEGRTPSERVALVETFTGDAFLPSDPSWNLLTLAPSSLRYLGVPYVVRNGGDVKVTVEFKDPQSGQRWAQEPSFTLGKGRVVALADAAMLTAQEDGGRKIGMNTPGNDNRQFALNVMHWLGRLLPER